MSSILSGLIAATFTPFLPNEEVNLTIIPQMADLLVRNGVSGAFICGTTGEGFSMTSDERQRTAEENRAKFGRSKSEAARESAERTLEETRLDGHRLDDGDVD